MGQLRPVTTGRVVPKPAPHSNESGDDECRDNANACGLRSHEDVSAHAALFRPIMGCVRADGAHHERADAGAPKVHVYVYVHGALTNAATHQRPSGHMPTRMPTRSIHPKESAPMQRQ